jgi:RNA polymerase sigma-70 factor (ECF subfamily)
MSEKPTDPDVELMARFQGGDEEAYNELVRRNYRSVLNLIYRFIGRREDANDLAQDVFLGVYRARRTYRPTAKFSTWLYKNTLNICLNFNRAMRHRRAASLSAESAEGEGPMEMEDRKAQQPSDVLEKSELRDKVREAVDALPPNQRAAVLLARFEKLSYKEIAETMDLSVQAVKSLLSRAKENLRYKLSLFLKKVD